MPSKQKSVWGTKMKQFDIVPIDIIKGGSFAYSFDPKQGLLEYVGVIHARKFLFSKSIPFEGKQKVDGHVMLSSRYEVGSEVKFANLKGKVVSIEDGVAKAYVVLRDPQATAQGYAHFDVSGEYLELMALDAAGYVNAPVIGQLPYRLVLTAYAGFAPMAKKDTVWPTDEGGDK